MSMIGSGTACSNITAGKVVNTFTYTDKNGNTHSNPSFFGTDQKAATFSATFSFNTSLTTEGWSGSYVFTTDGSAALTYTGTYTACTTGTGSFDYYAAVSKLQ